jgi:hypothetical protein
MRRKAFQPVKEYDTSQRQDLIVILDIQVERMADLPQVGEAGHLYEQHIALCLTGLAQVALARGRPARAARLLGAAQPLRLMHPLPRLVHARVASAVRAAKEVADYDAVWAAGQAMPLDQIIAEALEEAPAG